MSSIAPSQTSGGGGGGRRAQTMASQLKIHHNKSIHEEAYAKLLKSHDWNAPLPPRGYVFGVGRGAKPLNSTNDGVVVGAGSKSDHGGLTASQLSYFDALDAIDASKKIERDAARAAGACSSLMDAAAAAAPTSASVAKFSMDSLASMERSKVGKALKGSLRDEDGGELAEEAFFADDAGAEQGLSRAAKLRLLGQVSNVAGGGASSASAAANGGGGGGGGGGGVRGQQRIPLSEDQLREILSSGDESKQATWINRARALFDAQESSSSSSVGGGGGGGGGSNVTMRSVAESLRILEKATNPSSRRGVAVAAEGPHVWREKLFATLGWGPYCEDEPITEEEEEEREREVIASGSHSTTTSAASVRAARCSLTPLNLLKGLQNPSLYKIAVSLLPAARAIVAAAVEACPSAVELWSYSITLQATQIAAAQQSQRALAANPMCVPLYRFVLEQLDTFDDRIALVKAGLDRSPFSEGLLRLASLLHEQQCTNADITAARGLFLGAAGRFAREHASRLPPFSIMVEAILLEDRQLIGSLKSLAKGSGVALCDAQISRLREGLATHRICLPWLEAVDLSASSSSSMASSASSSSSLHLQHLLSLIANGTHSISKIVAKTAKLHLTDAITRRAHEASAVKNIIKAELVIREQQQQQNSSGGDVAFSQYAHIFADYSVAELGDLATSACSGLAVKSCVVTEWVCAAITAASNGNIMAGMLMLRELLKMQVGVPVVSAATAAEGGGAPAPAAGAGASPQLIDYSSLTSTWCADLISFCLNKHAAKDNSAKTLATLTHLVTSINATAAAAAGGAPPPHIISPAVAAEAQRRQQLLDERSNKFISQVLHFEREKKREKARAELGAEYISDAFSTAPGEASLEDGAASNVLFGSDGSADGSAKGSSSSSSSPSSSAAGPANVKALVTLMVWLMATMSASATAESEGYIDGDEAAADVIAGSDAVNTAGGATATATAKSSSKKVIANDLLGILGPADLNAIDVKNVNTSVAAAAVVKLQSTLASAGAAVGGGASASGGGASAAYVPSISPLQAKLYTFDWVVARSTPIDVYAGLVQTFVSDVAGEMARRDTLKERARVVDGVLAKRAAASSPSSLSHNIASSAVDFSPVKCLFDTSHPLGKLLRMLLGTTNSLVWSRTMLGAKRLLSYCAWGGRHPLLFTAAGLSAKRPASCFAPQQDNNGQSQQGDGAVAAANANGRVPTDTRTDVKSALPEVGNPQLAEGEEANAGIACFVPSAGLAAAVAAGGRGGSGIYNGSTASIVPAVGPMWSDKYCCPTAVPLYNATLLEEFAHLYVKQSGRGFAASRTISSASLAAGGSLGASHQASSSATATSVIANAFECVVSDLRCVGGYSRVVGALFADGLNFAEAMSTLAQALALIVRLCYAIPLQRPLVSATEEDEVKSSVSTATEMKYGMGHSAAHDEVQLLVAVRRVSTLLSTRRGIVLDQLMPILISSAESLVLHLSTLLQQSNDAQIALYARAEQLVAKLREAAVGAANAASTTATTSEASSSSVVGFVDSLQGLAVEAGRIATAHKGIIVLQQQISSAAPSSAPIATVSNAIRQLIDGFLLPNMSKELATALSLFSDQHGLKPTVTAGGTVSAASAVAGVTSNTAAAVRNAIAANVNRALSAAPASAASGVGGGAAADPSASAAVATALLLPDAQREAQISIAVKTALWPSVPTAPLPPSLISTTALLNHSTATVVPAAPANGGGLVAAGALFAAPPAAGGGPAPSSYLPMLPPHLWPLLRSERLWCHRATAERYFGSNVDVLSAPMTTLTSMAAVAGAAAREAMQAAKEKGLKVPPEHSFANVTPSALVADLKSNIGSTIVAGYEAISNHFTHLSAAVASPSLPSAARALMERILGDIAPLLAHFAANAKAFAAVGTRVRQIRQEQYNASKKKRSGGGRYDDDTDNATNAAAAVAAALPPLTLGTCSPLGALLSIAVMGRSIHSRALWGMAVRALSSAHLKRCREVAALRGGGGSTSGGAANGAGIAQSGPTHNSIAGPLFGGAVGGASAAAGNSADDAVAAATIANIRALCEEAKKHCPIGPSLPRSVLATLRLASGSQMSAFVTLAVGSNNSGSSNNGQQHTDASASASIFGTAADGAAASSSSAAAAASSSSSSATVALSKALAAAASTENLLATSLGVVDLMASRALEGLAVVEESLLVWVGAVAHDCLAAVLADHQGAVGMLDRAEALYREYLAPAEQRRSEVDGRVEALEKVALKEVQREEALAKGRGGEFNKGITLQLMRQQQQQNQMNQSTNSSGGSGVHRRHTEEDLTFLKALKSKVTDAIYFKLLRGLMIVLTAKVQMEKARVLGSEAKATSTYLLNASLPAALKPHVNSSSSNSGGQSSSIRIGSAVSAAVSAASPRPDPVAALLASNGVVTAAAAASLAEGSSSSDAAADSSSSSSLLAVALPLPSSIHREVLSLIKAVGASTVTRQMGEVCKAYGASTAAAVQRLQQQHQQEGTPLVLDGTVPTFSDFISGLGVEALCELCAVLIDCEAPREKGIAIATVMNRLSARHPATYLAVGRVMWGHGKYAAASVEVLKALDHSRGRSGDAWLMVAFAMLECQRLLSEALETLMAEVEGRLFTTEEVVLMGASSSAQQPNVVTATRLRAASTRFTSSVEFVVENILRPFVTQFFGGATAVVGMGGGGSGAAAGDSAPVDYSTTLLPEGYASVGQSLSSAEMGLIGSSSSALSADVVAAAFARHDRIATVVGTAVEACYLLAVGQLRSALGALNRQATVRSGGLSLVPSPTHAVGPANSGIAGGSVWSYVVGKAALSDTTTTGLRWNLTATVDECVGLLTVTSAE